MLTTILPITTLQLNHNKTTTQKCLSHQKSRYHLPRNRTQSSKNLQRCTLQNHPPPPNPLGQLQPVNLVGSSQHRTTAQANVCRKWKPTMNHISKDELMCKINFTAEQTTRLTNLRRNALIIRTTGRQLDTIYLKTRLLSMWKLKAKAEIHHLCLSYYVIFNLLNENRVKLLTSAWRLGRDPILVRQWTLDFLVKKASTKVISILWVSLPFLPIEYHCPESLITIGSERARIATLDVRHTKSLLSKFGQDLYRMRHQQVIYENFIFFSYEIDCLRPATSMSPGKYLTELPLFCPNSNSNKKVQKQLIREKKKEKIS